MIRVIIICAMISFSACLSAQQQVNEIRKSIFFGGGSYAIDGVQSEELILWLDSVPDLLEKYEIQLISHTDPIGGRAFNEWLSRMRSQAVLELLLDHQIPEVRVAVKDWAYDNPVYTNSTHQGRIMNRRVDVILYPIIF